MKDKSISGKYREKRGLIGKVSQVTLFMIIGLIVLLSTVMFLFTIFRSDLSLSGTDKNLIENYYEPCVQKSLKDLAGLSAVQGGYVWPRNNSVKNGLVSIAYYYNGSNDSIPTIESIEKNIGDALTSAECLHNSSVFESMGYKIESEDAKFEVHILENEVSAILDMGFIIAKDNQRNSLSGLHAIIPMNYGKAYKNALLIVDHIKENKKIDITFLSSLDMEVTVMPLGNDTLVYSIRDDEIEFNFAEKIIINRSPKISAPEKVFFKVGEDGKFQINATDEDDDQIKLSLDNPLFSIDKSGLISFYPEMAGNYELMVIAEDDDGNRASKIIGVVAR